VYRMIPETYQAKEVRIYETDEDLFPLGWKLVRVPLIQNTCSRAYQRLIIVHLTYSIAVKDRIRYIMRLRTPLKLVLILQLLLIVATAFILVLLTTDITKTCVDLGSYATDQCFNLDKNKDQNFLPGFTPKLTPPMSIGRNTEMDTSSQTNSSRTTDDPLVVITAASPAFMERLRNFVGSVHYWEPYIKIVVYDLGLTKSNFNEVSQWKRVEILPFPFDRYPVHVTLLSNFAWKILMLDDALKRHPRLIYLDSGLEVRRPHIRYYLDTDGYYSIVLNQGRHTIGRETHPGTYPALKKHGAPEFDAAVMGRNPFCAGGVQGLVRGRVEQILRPAVECALDERCIEPVGSQRGDHNWDQSVLSVLVHATGKKGTVVMRGI